MDIQREKYKETKKLPKMHSKPTKFQADKLIPPFVAIRISSREHLNHTQTPANKNKRDTLTSLEVYRISCFFGTI